MEPVLINGELTKPLRTEAEYRAEREKCEADRIATENTLAFGNFQRDMMSQLFGGIK